MERDVEYYNDIAAYYDVINANREDEFAFYEDYVKPTDAVLEVACGSGTLTDYLEKSAKSVVAFDLARDMLDLAEERVPNATFFEGDMRDFDYPQKFDKVICPFKSLMHLHTEADIRSAFKSFAKHCRPGGEVLIDVYNLDPSTLPNQTAGHASSEYRKHASGIDVKVCEDFEFDRSANKLSISISVIGKESDQIVAESDFSIKFFNPTQLVDWARDAGLFVAGVYGNYTKDPFVPLSRHFICAFSNHGVASDSEIRNF